MKNKLKNIALWTIMTASLLGVGCRDKTEQKSINTSTKAVSLEESLTSANQILRDFPKEIQGVKNIEKYEVSGAKYCLAHIKQQHFKEADLEKYSEKFRDIAKAKHKDNYNKTNDIQENILNILNKLGEMGHNEIFSEGVTETPSRELLEKNYNERANYLINSGFYKNEFENKEYEKFMHIPGAGLELGMEGLIKILPTENNDILNKALNSKNPEKYSNSRENHILFNISKSNKYFAPLIFGEVHNFKDNIIKWNKENPDKKYSLIEIVPKNL
jgi:hypothetical protein